MSLCKCIKAHLLGSCKCVEYGDIYITSLAMCLSGIFLCRYMGMHNLFTFSSPIYFHVIFTKIVDSFPKHLHIQDQQDGIYKHLYFSI